jgi:hypothetical protein
MPELPAAVEARRRAEEDPRDRLQRERVGVAGDPTPDHAYGDPPPVEFPQIPRCPACDQHGERDGEVWRCANLGCRVVTFEEGDGGV